MKENKATCTVKQYFFEVVDKTHYWSTLLQENFKKSKFHV